MQRNPRRISRVGTGFTMNSRMPIHCRGNMREINHDNVIALSEYATLDYEPELVFDPVLDYYRKAGAVTTFSDLVTHARASNATMVDSDGLLKWAPHNLSSHSQEFDNAAWVKAGVAITPNATTAPDGTMTADLMTESVSGVTEHNLEAPATSPSNVNSSMVIFAKPNGRTVLRLDWVNSDANYVLATLTGAGTINAGSGTITQLPDGWYRLQLNHTPSFASSGYKIKLCFDAATISYAGDGTSGMYIWAAHVYRSDLGGMVDNPDTGNSYVPTTSAARYLARRNHHISNGSAWVNEGVLVESAAATNLVTYSNDFTNAAWIKVNTTISTNTLVAGSTGSAPRYTGQVVSGIVTSTRYVASVEVSAQDADYAQIVFSAPFTANTWANFDLVTGVVGSLGADAASSGMESLGGGRYRIYMSAVSPGAGNVTATVGAVPASTSARLANLTATISDSLLTIENYQFEVGSVPSSYIPTSGSTVTRAAETLTIAGADVPYSATAMSFQMRGRVSYADLNQSSSPYLYEWYSTGTNYIDLFIDADRGTGGVNARQRDTASGLDIVEDGGSSFTPGLNVPYNIATRNTSNAINLAISGSAGTADTTPTALPNLSASLLRFGTIAGGSAAGYNGTIGLFRAWGQDITDAGIEEASTP